MKGLKHLQNAVEIRNLQQIAHRNFAVISSSMLRPACVDISERIAELTLSSKDEFVKLKDRKRALKLVTKSHLGLVSDKVSKLVLNGSSCIGSRDQIKTLKDELEKIDKMDEEYIREPAPNINMLHPQSWYPQTRTQKRKIIYHYGPTNSGKTYHALEALKKAKNGVYCAPLRLLAWEVYENLSESGISSRLVTGEEMFGDENATHTSCTVEMADVFEAQYDIAVIDEIQLMGQTVSDRGWAWTRALLGINADEIHVCGDETVRKLVKTIAKKCGDSIEYKKYKRLCPLRMDASISDYSDIQRGDCIVGFNRSDLYKIKNDIERNTSYKCALIYGRLPPENRRTQAKLFNKENTGYDILISSDAIGMGLNLNIRRIIFYTVQKWNGFRKTNLTTSEVLQIAGRAGRYKLYDEGYVSCINMRDYQYIYDTLKERPPTQTTAGLRPEETHIHDIAQRYPWLRFSDIIKCLTERSKINADLFFIPNYNDMLQIAHILEHIPLSVKDKYIFTTMPLRQNAIEGLGFIQEWAVNLANDKLVHLDVDEKQLIQTMQRVQTDLKAGINALHSFSSNGANGKNGSKTNGINASGINSNLNMSDINDIELLYSILSCYRFLSFRFPTFVDYQKCEHLLQVTANMIQQGFDDVTIQNKYRYRQSQLQA